MHDHQQGTQFDPEPPTHQFADPLHEDLFHRLVREHLGRDGKQVDIHDGCARVQGSEVTHGLNNLAQMCHLAAPSQWPEIVRRHLDKSNDRALDAMRTAMHDDYEANADKLVVRLRSKHFLVDAAQYNLVHRIDLPHTCSLLAIDLGPSVMPVPAPVAATWGKPIPELFDRAILNLKHCCKARWSQLAIPPGRVWFDLLHGDFHAPSHVLRQDVFLPRVGAHGNLIGLPAAGVLMSYAIDAMPAVATLEAMLAISTGKFQDGPGSITPHLYWRTQKGAFHVQQGANRDGRMQFAPSPEFVALLARLRRAKGRSGSER